MRIHSHCLVDVEHPHYGVISISVTPVTFVTHDGSRLALPGDAVITAQVGQPSRRLAKFCPFSSTADRNPE